MGDKQGERNIINIDEALRQYGGDKELLTKMLSQFSAYSSSISEKLRVAAAAADFETVRREAHSLKGSSSYIGAVQVPKLGK